MEQNENMTVQEMSMYLRIGICNAYKLTREQGFPAVHIGKKIIIPKTELDRWIAERAGKGE